MKNYLSSNPLIGGTYGQFKLDIVTKEILEIFSNQIRISIERLNTLKKYQPKKHSKSISPARTRNTLENQDDKTLPSKDENKLGVERGGEAL